MTDDSGKGHPVLETVLIAGLSALVTGLANVAVERLTKRRRKKKPKTSSKGSTDAP